MIAALIYLLVVDVGILIIAATDELDYLERVSRLSTPALLVLFIVLLARGKLRWERDVLKAEEAAEAWKQAALLRAEDAEEHARAAETAARAAPIPARRRGGRA